VAKYHIGQQKKTVVKTPKKREAEPIEGGENENI